MSWTSANTNFFQYFPGGTPDETACLSVFVKYFDETFQADGLWMGLGFLFGFIIGAVVVAICARPCLRDMAKKRLQEEEEAAADEMGVSLREYRQMKGSTPGGRADVEAGKKKANHPLYIEADLIQDGKRKGSKKKKKMAEDENEEADVSGVTVNARGLADALVQTNSDGTDAELISQDFDSVVNLDKTFQTERQEAFVSVLRILLNKLKNKDKVDENFCKNFLKKTEEEMTDIVKMCDKEKEEEVEELKKNSKLMKDPQALENEIEKLDPKYSQKMINLLKEHRQKLRGELTKSSGLTEAEVDALFLKLKRNMANLEDRLANERLRSSVALEERLKRRRQLAQMKQLQDKGDNEEFTLRQESLDNVTTDMVQDGKLQEKQRDEILAEHAKNMNTLQDQFSAESKRSQLILADKLRQRREGRLRKLTLNQQKEHQHFIAMSDKETSTDNFVEGFHQLLEQQRFEREHFTEETDKMEILEFEKLRKDLSKDKQTQLAEEEAKMVQSLKNQSQLSTREADRLIKLYHQQSDYYKRQQLQERQAQQASLQHKIELRRQKMEEEEQLVEAEQKAFMEQQEDTIQKTIEFNMELEDDDKARLLEEHRQNMLALNNQLQMSRMKQQKNLERRLSQRRARLADWKEKQEDAKRKKSEKNQKEKDKITKDMEKTMELEEKKIEEEREMAVDELRKNLASETEMLLKGQDSELGLLIGRLQVGQARRQAILQKQDKTLQELQSQLEKKVIEEAQLPRSETDQIIQQHYNQVAHLNQQVQMSRQRQEHVLQEKLQAKKLRKSREIESVLKQEVQEDYLRQRHTRIGLASTIFGQSLMEQRHKQKIANLEREMKLEMEKEKDELNQQLETELQKELENQKKDFLAQLAAISSLSKSELDEVVEATVANKGSDTKTARKLAKDLRQDLRRAKSSLGIEEEEEDRGLPELQGLRRPKTSLGHYSNGGFEEERPYQAKSVKKNKFLRKPKEAFAAESHRAYTPPGDEDDDF